MRYGFLQVAVPLLLIASPSVSAQEASVVPALGILAPKQAEVKIEVPKSGLWRPVQGDFVCADTVSVLDDSGRRIDPVTTDPKKGQYRVRLDGCLRFSAENKGTRLIVRYQYRPRRVAVLPPILGTDYEDALPALHETLNAELERRGFVPASGDDLADAIARVRQASGSNDAELGAETLRALASSLNVAYLLLPALAATDSEVFAGYQSHTWPSTSGRSTHTTATAYNRHYMDVAAGMTCYDGLTGRTVFQQTTTGSKRVRFRQFGPARRDLVRELTTRLLSQWREPPT